MRTAKQVLRIYEQMTSCSDYTNDRTLSQDVASLFIPRRSDISTEKNTGTVEGWYDKLYEPHPINAAQTLATGQYDLLFSGKWFETDAPSHIHDLEKIRAFREVGVRMRKEIEKSNFKLSIQEFLADRSTVHTAAMLIEEIDGEVVFTHVKKGNYAISDDDRGRCDRLCRWFKLSARQAKSKFRMSDDRLPKKVLEACKTPEKEEQEFVFVHLIEPNYDRNPSSEHKRDKPFSSYYICKDDPDTIIREGGYDEQPFVVSRYNRWGSSPYGTGPSHIELSRARGLQVMKRDMLALGSRVTSPGTFTLGSNEEGIDPYGENIISAEEAALRLPREYQYSENYTIPESIFEGEKRALDETFLVPLFQLLTSEVERNREKTAFEVQAMLEEKMGKASPTFDRFLQEVLELLLMREFGILLRRGVFNDLVGEMAEQDEQTGEVVGLNQPKVNFTSKLARALKAHESNAFSQWLNENLFIFQSMPEKMNKFDWYARLEKSWLNHGLPADQVRSQEEVDEENAQQAQMQQMAMALEGAQGASQVAKNLR